MELEPEKSDDFVNVSVRVRPFFSLISGCVKISPTDPSVLYVTDRQQGYSFDNIFSDESTQEEIYVRTVKPLVERVIEGYNSTVFAYGQTGTGKTYTIGTNPEDKYIESDTGLISRALADLLSRNDENKEVSISVSFSEIYNEKVYDLLTHNNSALPVNGFKVKGLSQHKVETEVQAEKLLLQGGRNRHIGGTKKNARSSRSHAIFTINCSVKYRNSEKQSKLNLVDLAGSERIKKTGNEGYQLHEGININKGLLCIGKVINALSMNLPCVPYRESVITTILQDSLSKKNYVSFIACVSQHVSDSNETSQTLDFAQRVKKLKNKPELNSIVMEYSRSSAQKYKTPARKQLPFRTPSFTGSAFKGFPKQLHSTLMHDPVCENNVQFSDSMASISTINDAHNFSPIIKKCITAVEDSIMEKLEKMFRNIKTPLRSSPRIRELTKVQTGTENIASTDNTKEICKFYTKEYNEVSPNASPIAVAEANEISSPIFKVPRAMTRTAKRKSSFDTSSPLTEVVPRRSSRLSIKQLSIFDTPVKEASIGRKKTSSPTFKEPMAIPRAVKRKSDLSSPHMEVVPRRSGRLSIKQLSIFDTPMKETAVDKKKITSSTFIAPMAMPRTLNRNPSMNTSSPLMEAVPRRSSRLSIKQLSIFDTPVKETTIEQKKITSSTFLAPMAMPRTLNRNSSLKTSSPLIEKAPRRSVRLSVRPQSSFKSPAKKVVHVKWLPTPAPRSIDKTKRVLHLLNHGSEKDVAKLNTIGKKSAAMIVEYRQIKGPFKKISDISQMPWRGKGYQRFLECNFIPDDS